MTTVSIAYAILKKNTISSYKQYSSQTVSNVVFITSIRSRVTRSLSAQSVVCRNSPTSETLHSIGFFSSLRGGSDLRVTGISGRVHVKLLSTIHCTSLAKCDGFIVCWFSKAVELWTHSVKTAKKAQSIFIGYGASAFIHPVYIQQLMNCFPRCLAAPGRTQKNTLHDLFDTSHTFIHVLSKMISQILQ